MCKNEITQISEQIYKILFLMDDKLYSQTKTIKNVMLFYSSQKYNILSIWDQMIELCSAKGDEKLVRTLEIAIFKG